MAWRPWVLVGWALALALAPASARGSPLNLDYVADRLAFLKDYFKVHVYVNPRPACAVRAESCALDEDCCGGLECRMTASADQAVAAVCQRGVDDVTGDVTDADPDTREAVWNFGVDDDADDDDVAGSTFEGAQRERVLRARRRHERPIADGELVQELRRPLTADELVSLRRSQEADDLRTEQRLRELEEWKRRQDDVDEESERERARIETLARERVAKVLREEQRQKMDMVRRMQDAARAAEGGNRR